ncbi:MAG: sigma-70 family RNA polymerase sigma factor [Alphaproteobacteria bacterium]|nr:sigma-70 family RNA polymerase sigma factor [Alphaproteobacteria bacterium]
MPPDLHALYLRTAPALLRKCERLLGSRADAEDIVQQLFVDLIRRGRTDVELPYLYRAATTRSLNRIRDHKRRRALVEQHGDDLLYRQPARIDDRVLSQALIVRLVEALDDDHAEVLALHFVDGLDQGEVADLLGVSRRTVVKRVGRIRDAAARLAEGA